MIGAVILEQTILEPMMIKLDNEIKCDILENGCVDWMKSVECCDMIK